MNTKTGTSVSVHARTIMSRVAVVAVTRRHVCNGMSCALRRHAHINFSDASKWN
jgi:hypothetical protein